MTDEHTNASGFFDDTAIFVTPFSVSELSERLLIRHDYIERVLELGCPTTDDGKVSAKAVFEFVAENCERFCSAERLPTPQPITAVSPDDRFIQKVMRAQKAISEYHELRSDFDRKQELRSQMLMLKQVIGAVQNLRNRPCDCGSGLNFKDCCGKS
jgi:SEC-C motif